MTYKELAHCSLLCVLFILCCKSDPSEDNQNIQANTAIKDGTEYPSIPTEKMEFLWKNCDYVDVLFNNSPVSMSQNEQNGIRGMLQFISTSPASHKKECQSDGRMSFMVSGKIEAEADIYLSEGCGYFTFVDGNQITHANLIAPEGLRFFRSVITSSPEDFNK